MASDVSFSESEESPPLRHSEGEVRRISSLIISCNFIITYTGTYNVLLDLIMLDYVIFSFYENKGFL